MGLGILCRRQRFRRAFATWRTAVGFWGCSRESHACGRRTNATQMHGILLLLTAFLASVWPTMLRSNLSTTCFGVKSDRSSKACSTTAAVVRSPAVVL